MDIEIKDIRRKDFNKILSYSGEGMGVGAYTDDPREIRLYSRYFWYMELTKATQIICAYENDEPVGVLLADMNGEKKAYRSVFARIIIGLSDFLMGIIFKGGANSYSQANDDMLKKFLKDNKPDGELCFLAVQPDKNGRGIGTILLNELAKRAKGRLIYLFTDSNCTYQFYDKRGFALEQKRNITLDLHGNKIPLDCFLYSKKL